MKDSLMNIKGEDRQERRQLDINDNTEDHLDGDGCFAARIRYAWIKESTWFT